jgi:putative ABC transport system permease protein
MPVSLRRTGAPAMQSLRVTWGTTVLLVAACAAGLAVMLPVAGLASWTHAGIVPGISLPPVRASDLGILWGAFAQTPTEVREAAVAALVRLLLGVAVGVLAVTWLTTLSASMARASGRAVEIAVRRAVGASRRHILAAVLLEGAAISALALVVGGVSGVAAARASLGAWPGAAAPGAHALGLVAVAATLGGIVLGALFPLVFARRSSRMTTVDPTPLGLVVPALQLGLSLTVLASGSLLERGSARLTSPAGARIGMGTVWELTTRDGPSAERALRYRALLREVRSASAVTAVSLTSPGTITGLGPVDVVWSECGACSWGGLALPIHGFFATHYVVSADTFRALRLPLVAGRTLTDADASGAPPVAVVSRSLAQEHFDAKGAVGKLLLLVGHLSTTPYRVVGVVDDQPPRGLGGALEPREAVYLSVLQHPPTAVDLLVRGRLSADALDGVARAIRDTLGPDATVTRVSEASLLAAEAAPLRWFAGMFGAEGWGLLAIATLGTFAMMWLWVTSLLAELGVRRAVGARRRYVMGYVLWRALLVAVAGAAFGSWLGMMVWDALGNLVSGLPAWDPGAVLRYGLLLCGAALAGALLPAWRAAHAQPTTLLATGV